MSGILYGIGVGPGDPELMTLKAVRIIKETEVIAVPGKCAQETAAYRIAVQAVPELAEKKLIALDFPMTRDRGKLAESHAEAAGQIETILKSGKDAAFLTLGDVTIYSTFSYVQKIVERDGFQTELISGVPSFCAAAARCGIPLVEGKEMLHVIPAVYLAGEKKRRQQPESGSEHSDVLKSEPAGDEQEQKKTVHQKPAQNQLRTWSREPEDILNRPGTCVLMKAGSGLKETKDLLRASEFDDQNVVMVENCGMPDEKIRRGLSAIPDKAGYFSILIAFRAR